MLVGAFDQAMMTAFDDETVITWVDGKPVAHEAGTTTGDDQVLGTATVVGTKTNDETGTVTTNELGTETTTLDGTDDGTLDEAMIAIDGDEAIMMNDDDDNDETSETGKTTGDDHVDGTVIEFGTET
jgi:hypothetical protein